MFINNFDPVAIEIFSLEIRWYSLAYIIGILLGWYLAKKILLEGITPIFNVISSYIVLVAVAKLNAMMVKILALEFFAILQKYLKSQI